MASCCGYNGEQALGRASSLWSVRKLCCVLDPHLVICLWAEEIFLAMGSP